MKKTPPATTKQKKSEPGINLKLKESKKECVIFTQNNDDWNVHQDNRANIISADFHQMDSASSLKNSS